MNERIHAITHGLHVVDAKVGDIETDGVTFYGVPLVDIPCEMLRKIIVAMHRASGRVDKQLRGEIERLKGEIAEAAKPDVTNGAATAIALREIESADKQLGDVFVCSRLRDVSEDILHVRHALTRATHALRVGAEMNAEAAGGDIEDEAVAKANRTISEAQNELAQAFLAKHGLDPDDAMLCVQPDGLRISCYYVKKREDDKFDAAKNYYEPKIAKAVEHLRHAKEWFRLFFAGWSGIGPRCIMRDSMLSEINGAIADLAGEDDEQR